jgi:excisionase family DNA binding protein
MSEGNITSEARLLRATEVARLLNVSRSMAYRLIKSKAIPAVRINHSVRVQSDDLEEYIRRHYQGWDDPGPVEGRSGDEDLV